MYKKILVPLDGSEFAERSLEQVKAIARGCSVPEVVLIGVVEPVQQAGELTMVLGGDWNVKVEKEALDWLKIYLANIAGKLGGEGVTAKTAIARGKAADEILDYAAKSKADLIVMTTHGRSGLARWAMGSVADRIVRHAQVPVLLISSR